MKRLSIVGSGPKTRDQAPWTDETIDIWVFNEAGNHPWCKRWNACFQMHEPNIYKGHNTKDAKHWDWLQQKHGKPIYMQEVDPDVPDSIRFPLADALQLAGVKMLSSTFSYMAALAIMQGYEEIQIYGVELSSSEYAYQANGYLFWFGFLRGRLGDKVSNAITYIDNNIFDAPLYGYEGSFSIGAQYFAERVTFLDGKWKAADKNLNNVKKAIERAIDKYEIEDVQNLTKQYQITAMETGEIAGALAEAERYQTFGDRYADRGGFENAAAQAQQNMDNKRAKVWHYSGMIEYVWNVWKHSKSTNAEKQLKDFISQMGTLAYDAGAITGLFNENIEYLNKFDRMSLANGKQNA